ncbi:MAG: glutaredoxin family protein [Halobacteriota archaeon]|nr:glutaredoxin family protein [Halobacteriota archaeon]
MEMKHIAGENRGDVKLYTLSTCGWCKKTKGLLSELGVEYSYIDVDLLEGRDKKEVMDEVKRQNPQCSFPTLVINGNKCIVGFKEDKIREAIGR